MKRLVQFLLTLSVLVAAAALWQLGHVWIGYSIGEAFNSGGIFRTPENFEAEHQIRLWASYFLVAVCVIVTLLVTYRRNYRPERK
jgi:hypothetical protein